MNASEIAIADFPALNDRQLAAVIYIARRVLADYWPGDKAEANARRTAACAEAGRRVAADYLADDARRIAERPGFRAA